MLAYLNALCSALRARDTAVIAELLEHPLASALPPVVVEEARRLAGTSSAENAAPIHTLRLYHQTAHLLGVCADPASKRRQASPSRPAHERPRQMELPLHAAVA